MDGPRIDIWDMRTQTAVYQSLDTVTGTTPTCVSFSNASKYIHVGYKSTRASTYTNSAFVYRSPHMSPSTPVGQMLGDGPLQQVASVSEVLLSFRCLGCASRSNTVAYGNNDGLVSIVDYSFP